MVSVLDVKEKERSSHEHAQNSDGGENAVKRHVDVASLWSLKRTIPGRLDPYDKKKNVIL